MALHTGLTLSRPPSCRAGRQERYLVDARSVDKPKSARGSAILTQFAASVSGRISTEWRQRQPRRNGQRARPAVVVRRASSSGTSQPSERLGRRLPESACADRPATSRTSRSITALALHAQTAAGRAPRISASPAIVGGAAQTSRPSRDATGKAGRRRPAARTAHVRLEPADQRQRQRRLAGAGRSGDQDAAIAEHHRGGMDVGLRQACVSLRPAASPRSARRGLRRAWCRGCSRPSACRHAPRRSAG